MGWVRAYRNLNTSDEKVFVPLEYFCHALVILYFAQDGWLADAAHMPTGVWQQIGRTDTD